MTVLVVDDDADTRELIRRVLMKDFELRIVEAADGRTALDRLAITQVDLMLLDLHMPAMNGLHVLEAVRRTPAHAGLKVVMMTGMADADQVRSAVRLGIAIVLVKPLTPTLLRERLSRLITEIQEQVDRKAEAAATPAPSPVAATVLPMPSSPRTEASTATVARQLFDPESPSVGGILDAACSLVGDPLRQQIYVKPVHAQMIPTITARWIYGSVHLQGPHGMWELSMHLPFTIALRVGAAAHQVTPDILTAADVRDVVLNLALELGSQLRDRCLENGVRLRVSSGRSGEQPAGALFRTLQYGPGLSRCLVAEHDVPTGAFQLIAHAAAATAV